MRADRCFNPFLDPASPSLVATIRLDESGLRLGTATRLVRFAEDTERLAVSQDADRFVALLSVAFRRPVSVDLLRHVEAASAHWQRGDKALANIRLAFAGMPRLEKPEDADRLQAAEYLLERGFAPRDLMKELGFDPTALDKYNPDQPRVPAGRGQESGRWAGDASGAASDQFDASTGRRHVPRIVEIAAKEPLVPGGLNVVPLTVPDPLDPKGLNQPLGPQEQQRIADTVNMIIAGNPADLATLEPHAYQNIADPVTGSVLPPPIGKYVTYYARAKSEPAGLARVVMDQGGQVYYTNNHYKSFYPVDIMRSP